MLHTLTAGSNMCFKYHLHLIFFIASSIGHILGYNTGLLTNSLFTFRDHACEQEKLRIRCPAGTSINVHSALFGRQVSSRVLCSISLALWTGNNTELPAIEDTNCLATSSLQVVLDMCQDQQHCVIHAVSEKFSRTDPCPRTSKYLQVAYKCRPNEFRSRTSCEGERMDLHCQRSKRIAIYSAMFGRTRLGVSTCPAQPGYQTDCQASCSLEVMMKRCHGKRRCHVTASEAVFGSACTPSTQKYLNVVYACVARRILKEMKDGDSYPVSFCDVRTTSTALPPAFTRKRHPTSTRAPRKPIALVTTPATKFIPSTTPHLTTITTNTSEVVVMGAVDEEGVGFIKDWLRTWTYLQQNEERLILYMVLGTCCGIILFLLAVIVRLCQHRREPAQRPARTGRRVKLEISEPMRSELPEDQSLLPTGDTIDALSYQPSSLRRDSTGMLTNTTLSRPTPSQRAGFSYPRTRPSVRSPPPVELHTVQLTPQSESSSTLTREGLPESSQQSDDYLPPYTRFEGAVTLPRGAGEDGGTLTRTSGRQSPRIDMNPRRPVGQSPLYMRRNAPTTAGGQTRTLPPQSPTNVMAGQPRTLPGRAPSNVRWAANGRDSPGPRREPSNSPTLPTPIMKTGSRRTGPPSPRSLQRPIQRSDSNESAESPRVNVPFPRSTPNGSLQRQSSALQSPSSQQRPQIAGYQAQPTPRPSFQRPQSPSGTFPRPLTPGGSFQRPQSPGISYQRPQSPNGNFARPQMPSLHRPPNNFPRSQPPTSENLPRQLSPMSTFQSPSSTFQRAPSNGNVQKTPVSPLQLYEPSQPPLHRQPSNQPSLNPGIQPSPVDSLPSPRFTTFSGSPSSPYSSSPPANSGLSLPPPHMQQAHTLGHPSR